MNTAAEPRVNLIIATYAGVYERKFNADNIQKSRFLRYNLANLNKIHHSISQITVMIPDVNPEHHIIRDYYSLDGVDVTQIQDKLVFMKCPNLGVSYGQFFRCVYQFPDFDYHIFVEDDYTLFGDDIDQLLVSEHIRLSKGMPMYLCSGILKTKCIDQVEGLYEYHKHSVKVNGTYDIHISIPDLSLGIINKAGVDAIMSKYNDLEQILGMMKNITVIHIHQILFGYVLFECGVDAQEINEYLSLYWENIHQRMRFYNFFETENNISTRPYNSIKDKVYKCPIYMPIDIVSCPQHYAEHGHVAKYLKTGDEVVFYNKLATIMDTIQRTQTQIVMQYTE